MGMFNSLCNQLIYLTNYTLLKRECSKVDFGKLLEKEAAPNHRWPPREIEGFSYFCLIQSVQLSRVKNEQTQAHHAGDCRNAA